MGRKIAAGNWKMNGGMDMLAPFLTLPAPDGVEVLICPPAPLIRPLRDLAPTFFVGGQDCHAAQSGAHTGDVSAALLRDVGATHVIVGHSERRADHGETSDMVRAKALAASAEGIQPIICVGETLAQREAGQTLSVVMEQVQASVPQEAAPADIIVAYEPVWAIGTGKVATTDEIAEVHAALRAHLPEATLLYGGSVKASNAQDIFAVPNVNGALVGGASLSPADFAPIIEALAAA